MPRRATRTVPTVLIPGWQGAGEAHWQTWLENRLRDAGRATVRPDFADLEKPTPDAWLVALRRTLGELPVDGYDVVAHSLGAVLWLHHVRDPAGTPRAARVALVSPPSPHTTVEQVAAFFPPPLDVDALRAAADGTVLVGSSNDPYLPEGIAAAYGLPLKIATTVVEDGGHLDVDAGYGEWPAVLDWCNRDNLAFY